MAGWLAAHLFMSLGLTVSVEMWMRQTLFVQHFPDGGRVDDGGRIVWHDDMMFAWFRLDTLVYTYSIRT